jgi:hypothetical protein
MLWAYSLYIFALVQLRTNLISIKWRDGDAWKKWKEELNLFIDLTMDDDNEPAKVKLFLYLIGTRGREIYETMTFANAPENRTFLVLNINFKSERAGTPKISITEIRYNKI